MCIYRNIFCFDKVFELLFNGTNAVEVTVRRIIVRQIFVLGLDTNINCRSVLVCPSTERDLIGFKETLIARGRVEPL